MSYDMIDRYLRNNLHDDDYAGYSAALDAVATNAKKPLTDDEVLKMWRVSNFRGSGGQADWFAEGIRAAERAHGIGA